MAPRDVVRWFGAAGLLALAACDPPPAVWVDEVPQRTVLPSPLAHPPFVAFDSVLADSSGLAEFLLAQDRLREAGATSLLTPVVDAMTGARQPLTTTAPVARAVATESAAGGSAGAPSGTSSGAPSGTPSGMAHDMSRDMTHDMSTMTHEMAAPASGADVTGLGNDAAPRDIARCARSLRLADAPGFGTVAAWWTRVARGRVHLVGAWRDKATGQWRGPIPIDTLDQGPADAQAAERGAHGCARPAPGLAWDARTAFVHVAYAVRGPEGPGVFYAHQMDPRAAFEVPVAVLYGDYLGAVQVASDGDVVAVAYDDPNARGRSAIGLAVSRTAGHSFEEQRLMASGSTEDARDPHVLVKGRAVVIGWSDIAGRDPVFVTRRLEVQR